MDHIFDQNYLTKKQYHRGNRLNARTSLHERFGTNLMNWNHWMFDHLPIAPHQAILDVGCGTGRFWQENWDRLSQNLHIRLMDLSAGMVGDVRGILGDDRRFLFFPGDAQAVPLESSSVDGVLANHMLYHVPNIPLAIDEFQRVMKPGGWLCTATNGGNHMKELYDLIRQFVPELPVNGTGSERYYLENAREYLAPVFGHVSIFSFPNKLWVTEAQAIKDYLHSLWILEKTPEETMGKLCDEIERRILMDGGFAITTLGGVIICRG